MTDTSLMAPKTREEWKRRALDAEAFIAAHDLPVLPGAAKDVARRREALVQDVHVNEDLGTGLFQPSVQFISLALRLQSLTKNTYDPAIYARRKNMDVNYVVLNNEISRFGTLNYIMCLLLRLKSEHVIPVHVAAISCLCYMYHLPMKLWNILSAFKIICSYQWTQQFCITCNAINLLEDEPRSAKIFVACYDNCSYYQGLQYQRTDATSLYLDSVNWYVRHVPPALDPNNGNFVALVNHPLQNPGHLMSNNIADHADLLEFCADYIGSLHHMDMFEYPDDPLHPGTKSECTIGIPIMEVSTASYQDNLVMLLHILYFIELDNPDVKYVILVGDEQTYDRMIKLKSDNPRRFEWLIPMPGEFHFCGHVCHCTLRLWWAHLLHPCSTFLQRENIHMDFTMSKFNAHDDFLLIVVAAFIRWFEHVFWPDCLIDRAAMMQRCRHNFTTTYMLQFLYSDGMPYAALRRLNRLSPAPHRRATIDAFYGYYSQRFRSVNKFLYAMLCYHYLTIKENLHPDLWHVWSSMYTMSVLGHPGRDTPCDGYMEKVNNFAKRLVGKIVSAARVRAVVPLLNFLLRLLSRVSTTVGRPGRRWVYTGAPTYQADVDTIFRRLCIQVADDYANATAPSIHNLFTGLRDTQTRDVNNWVANLTQDWPMWCARRMQGVRF